MLALDHFVVAVSDLSAAAATLLERDGLDSYEGGVHEGGITANRIVPLACGAYIELLAVVNPETQWSNPLAQLVDKGIATGERLVTWAVRTARIQEVARRLNLTVVAMARSRPDGTRLTWSVGGLDEALESRSVPFFIEWDQPNLHPALQPVRHRAESPRVAAFTVAAHSGSMARWLGDAPPLPMHVIDPDGEWDVGVRSVTIADAIGRPVRLGGPGWRL